MFDSINKNNFLMSLFVRSDSIRLPKKYLVDLNHQYNLLSFISYRTERHFDLCFLLPFNDMNSPLTKFIKSIVLDANIYYGSNENLIQRAFGALVLNSKQWLIRYTCDDPLKDFSHLEGLLKKCQELDSSQPYCVTSEFPESEIPYGLGWEIYSLGALRELSSYTWDSYSSEHISPAYNCLNLPIIYFEPSYFDCKYVFPVKAKSCALTFSIDTDVDLALIQSLPPSCLSIYNDFSVKSLLEHYLSISQVLEAPSSKADLINKTSNNSSYSFKSRFSRTAFDYVSTVLDSDLSSTCPTNYIEKIEKFFTYRTKAFGSIAMANGTATLVTALKAIGIKEGDEVVVSPLTMSSPSIAVMACGAVPVWCDIDPKTLLITAQNIKSVLTNKTKAVIFVSLYGRFDHLPEISNFCSEHGLFLIEDNAESDFPFVQDTIYQLYGDFASYSFQSSKNFTCGEGGMLVCRTERDWLKALQLSCLGYTRKSDGSRISKAEIQQISAIRHTTIGENYRLSELLAAVVFSQLEDEGFLMDSRRISALSQLDEISKYSLSESYKVTYANFSAWGVPIIFKNTETAIQFVKLYNSSGSRNCYPSWRLAPEEPSFDVDLNMLQIQNLLGIGFERYKELFLLVRSTLPVAFDIRARLVGLRTNHWSKKSLVSDLRKLHSIFLSLST